MKICQNKITDYASINISESETLWSASNDYDYADEIRYGHYIYKYAGVGGTNTEETPEFIWNRDQLIYPVWVRIRPTNYWAAIDGETDTQTQTTNSLVMSFNVSNYDSLALLGVEAEDVTISLYDNDSEQVVYNKIVNMQDEIQVIDFYSYCFEPFLFKPSLYLEDLPLYGNATITITLVSSIVKIGRIVLGRTFYIGDTEFGASLGIESYSSKSVDEFGNVSLLQRGSVNIDDITVRIPTNKVPIIRNKFKELDAKPLLFIADESEDSNVDNLLNFGYWTNLSILIPNPVSSTASISIKGIL